MASPNPPVLRPGGAISIVFLFAAIALLFSRSVVGFVHQEDSFISEAILEEKMDAYIRDGSRDLQDDPTQYCSSMMEVNLVSQAATYKVSVVYPVATGYPNNLRRCVVFKPTVDLFLSIEYTFISTELNFDFAEVYPISSFNNATMTVSGVGSRLIQLSGIVLPTDDSSKKILTSPGQTVMLVLRTDGNRNDWTGFQATVKSKKRDCADGISVIYTWRTSQTFSDGFVDAYPPNYSFCWIFVPPSNDAIQITFTAMNIEKDADFVEIASITGYDVTSKSYSGKKSPPYGLYSGLTIPPQITGQYDELIMLSFTSDESMQFTGFSGKVISVGRSPTVAPSFRPTTADCQTATSFFTAPSSSTGVSISDGLSKYQVNSAYCYVITPDSTTSYALISFTGFSLHSGGLDYIEVFPIATAMSTNALDRLASIKTFDSSSRTPVSVSGSAGQSLVIQFKTDSQGSSGGFTANVKSSSGATLNPTPAPSAKECSNGMREIVLSPDETIQIDDGMDGSYPDNFQYCVVLKPPKGLRIMLTFTAVDIGKDRLDIFPVRAYNLKTKVYRGKGSFLKRYSTTAAKGSDVIVSKTSQPVVVSLKAGYLAHGEGFKAEVVTVSAPPTLSPTSPGPCATKMSSLVAGLSYKKLDDGYTSVPKNSNLCWVVSPINANGYAALVFDTVGLGSGGILSVSKIESFDLKTKTFSEPSRTISVTGSGTIVQGRPGELLLVRLATDPNGSKTVGFSLRYMSPCFCPMFLAADSCNSASCSCKWTTGGCNFQDR